MDPADIKSFGEQIQTIIKDKVEMQCFLCMGEYDSEQYAPMMMCMNQHSCCAPCMKELLKQDTSKSATCPHCSLPILRKAITKNRYLMTIFQLLNAFKKQIKEKEQEAQSAKKLTSLDTKASLLSKNPKLVNSLIFGHEGFNKNLNQSIIFEDVPTSRSHAWSGNIQKRKTNILSYAERQRITQLKNIAVSNIPFEEVLKIRSGYGTIKKIECMEELLLYNNHIKVIEGLNNNIKLNVLSLAYNRIEKVENIGHLKEMKRLSLECNKIGKRSAQFLVLYDWKSLQSLSISFHEDNPEDNEECLQMMFGFKNQRQWPALKTLYIYNSRNISGGARDILKEFNSHRKMGIQVYWS